MAQYERPEKHLHQQFVYLDHDSILNALSAFESGKVDEIIERTSEAREGGLEGGVDARVIKAKGGKKTTASTQEELVRKRTWFSAFTAWHEHLLQNKAIGRFDGWDLEVRNALEVGDAIQFASDVELSPLHKVIATFLSYASEAGKPGSPFRVNSKDLAETRKTATFLAKLVGGPDGATPLTYLLPYGVAEPRVLARLDSRYLIGGLENLHGRFTVVGQVDQLLRESDRDSVIRILRDAPPTRVEIETAAEAMIHMIEPSKELGVDFSEADLTFTYPTVVLRALAVYR